MNGATPAFHLAARMAHIAPFEVMEIQSLARGLEARGRDVIHLEIGEPDFRTPEPVVEAGAARARRGAHELHLGAGAAGAARGDRRASTASATASRCRPGASS